MTPITTYLDCVCLGVNENREYIRWWPLVVAGWRKYFPEARIVLGFITNRTEEDSLVKAMRQYGDVRLFPIIAGIDTVNQARVLRYFLAASLRQSVVAIHDVDSVILHRRFYQSRLDAAAEAETDLLLIGQEQYREPKHERNCPAGYATAMVTTWANLIGRRPNMSWESFVKSQCGLESKADIRKNAVNHTSNRNGFCDESWLACKLRKWSGKVHHAQYGGKIADMVLWRDDHSVIDSNTTEVHHLIPMSAHMDKVNNVVRHLGCTFDPEWCDV